MIEQSCRKKIRVGVFMGGRSIEREVSFNSGRTICDHIGTSRFEPIPVFQTKEGVLYLLPWHFLHRGKIADFAERLDEEAQKICWDDLPGLVDFMYIAVHGRFAEDGTLQGAFEVLGIPYTGAKVLGSALGMNKAMQKAVVKAAGVSVPKGIVLEPGFISQLSSEKTIHKLSYQIEEAQLRYPLIIKPNREGSSLGISVVHQQEDLPEAIAKAYLSDPSHEQPVIVEEKLSGMEFTFVGLQSKEKWQALPLTEVIVEDGYEFLDYDQKYMPGRATKITPARCTDDQRFAIEDACITAANALEFKTITRIDGILTSDGIPYIFDLNSLSGMGQSSFVFNQAAKAGMSHTQFINTLIESELEQAGSIMGALKEIEDNNAANASVKKTRVGVLLGGQTHEREVSLDSGRNVCYKLSPSKYEVTPLFVGDGMKLYELPPDLLIKNATHEIVPHLNNDMLVKWSSLKERFDFVFIGLHGGKGEDGSVQGMLEMMSIPYNGPGVLASALCMDKHRTKEFLHSQGFAVPAGQLITKEQWLASQDSTEPFTHISFPLIVKPHDDGCSTFVYKVENEQELLKTLEEYFARDKQTALLEEYLVGNELTVGVIGNDKVTVLPASLSLSSDGSVLSAEDKFLPGHAENQTPAPFTEYEQALVQHTVSEVYKALGCKGYSRIDCFYQTKDVSPTNEDRVVILEINTLPALTPATCLFHQAAEVGFKPSQFIDLLVELGFQAHTTTTNNRIKTSVTPTQQKELHE